MNAMRYYRRFFSNSKNFDVVAIGPYANRAANHLSQLLNFKCDILTIEHEPTVLEPSLLPLNLSLPPVVALHQGNHTFSQLETGVRVVSIDPRRQEVTLNNGATYGFRFLVYSTDCTQWKPTKDTPNENIFNDYSYTGVNSMFSRKGGRAVFAIPQGLHFGYESYFMMLLKDKLQRNRTNANSYGTEEADVIVLNQGQTFSPNQQFNNTMESLLKEKSIRVIRQAAYRIDSIQKTITVKCPESKEEKIKFDTFFEYLPMRVPDLLEKAEIDPLKTDPFTLCHSQFESIYIIGNCFPDRLFSASAVNKMTEVVARNLSFDCMGIRKKVLYDGYTAWSIWAAENECVTGFSKDGDAGKQKFSPKFMRNIEAMVKRNLWRSKIQFMINKPPLQLPFQNHKVISQWPINTHLKGGQQGSGK